MVESREAISLGDRLSFKINTHEDPAEDLVFHGTTRWHNPNDGSRSRYGLRLLKDQGEVYQRFRRSYEITRAKTTARMLDLPYLDITPSMVDPRAFAYINRDLACSLNCAPLKLRGDRLMVAMSDPSDTKVMKKLELLTRCKIEPVVATPASIRSTLVQYLGVRFVPMGRDESGRPSIRRYGPHRQGQIVAVVSCAPEFWARHFVQNVAIALKADGARVLLADLQGERLVLSENVSEVTPEQCDWLMVTLSSDTRPLFLDWALKADETVLIVSPAYWHDGCLYADALFSRFVNIQKQQGSDRPGAGVRQRVLPLSVVCARLADMQEGFKTFSRLEASIHRELDMREPQYDIDLHYVGGVLEDRKNLQKAEKAGVPLAEFRPRSPASQCLTHIARSLLRPTQARDPRLTLNRSLMSRLLG
jgi:hypothetical protein